MWSCCSFLQVCGSLSLTYSRSGAPAVSYGMGLWGEMCLVMWGLFLPWAVILAGSPQHLAMVAAYGSWQWGSGSCVCSEGCSTHSILKFFWAVFSFAKWFQLWLIFSIWGDCFRHLKKKKLKGIFSQNNSAVPKMREKNKLFCFLLRVFFSLSWQEAQLPGYKALKCQIFVSSNFL